MQKENILNKIINDSKEQINLIKGNIIDYEGDKEQVLALSNKVKKHEFLIERVKRYLNP